MGVIRNIDQRFISQDCSQRTAAEPDSIRLILGWTAAGMCFFTALWLLPYYLVPGAILLAVALALAACMVKVGSHFRYQSNLRFELRINDEEITLRSVDERDRLDIIQSIRIASVRNVEYFEADDIRSLTLLASDHYLEIPLWAFGSHSQMVLDSMRAHGINFERERLSDQSGANWNRQRAA